MALMVSLSYELDTKPFLGSQAFRCPKCDTTRLTNLVAPMCKECNTEMVLIAYNPDAKWDFNGQEIFLTWSQTPENVLPQVVVESVQDAFLKLQNGVQDYLITREPHVEGGAHIHAYFRFERRFRTANRFFFDMKISKDKDEKPIHPNWQRVRGNKHKLFHYLKKDGEYSPDTKIGYLANFDSRPRVRQLVDDCNNMWDYWDGISHLGSEYWKVFAGTKLMALKMKMLNLFDCEYHKWVAGSDNGYYVCLNCDKLRHPDDMIQKGLTEKGKPRSLREIFGGDK